MKINNKTILLIVILLSLFLFQSLVTLKSTNLVFDDSAAITVGYYFLKYLDTSMLIAHPPLSLIIGGFPLLFTDVNIHYSYQECSDVHVYQCGQDMLFNSGNNPEKISVYAKIPFIIFSLLLGLLLFFFSKELYGIKAGLFSLTLYAFSPTILAYSTIGFSDPIITFFVFSTIYLLWKLIMQGYTKTRLILTGISFGFALASKFTAILLIPIIILLFAVKVFQDNNRKKALKKFSIKFMIILLIGFVTLHSTYFFSFDSAANSIPERNVRQIDSFINENLAEGSFNKKIANFLLYDLKMPMPGYAAGFAKQYSIGKLEYKRAYLNGEVYTGGKWYYFFEALLIKTPIPLIIFFIISSLFFIKTIKKRFMNEIFLLLPMLFFFGIFIIINFNLGLHYILPIMPFIFIFSSQILNIRLKNKLYTIAFRIFIGLLLLWYVLSALFTMPYYMAYFNEFIGGSKNGYKYLLGSNLDSGQNLKELNNYLKSNNIDNIKLSYHGTFDPSYYNISYDPLPMELYIPWVPGSTSDVPSEDYTENCTKEYGIIAISIANLRNVVMINKSCFSWLHDYEPIEIIGYAIYVFNITKPVQQ
jgi:hypothetical protein